MSDTQKIERRYVPTELRFDDQGRVEGYAAVFEAWSVDLGGFRERIRPGAFRETIVTDDIRALFNHDVNYVLGRNRAGTLELAEDSQGLQFRVHPPATTWANDLRVTIERGDVNQASFGFDTVKDDWQLAEGLRKRELIAVRLYDVSPVTFPAYPQTAVNVRSLMNEFFARLGAANDPGLVQYTIDQLETMLPAEDGREVDAAMAEARVRLAMLRRRLAVVKLK